MTQEEKAKAYDEALERARIWQNHLYDTNDRDYADELNYIFPELKETEDEKIRKAILNCFIKWWGNCKGEIYGIHAEDAIAWLEKQGETFTKIDVDDAYLKGVSDAKHELEKQGEQKSGWSEDDNSFCNENCKGYQETGRCFADGDCKAKREAEQNPAWSEEDFRNIENIDSILFYDKDLPEEACIRLRNWLKSLKERINEKQ